LFDEDGFNLGQGLFVFLVVGLFGNGFFDVSDRVFILARLAELHSGVILLFAGGTSGNEGCHDNHQPGVIEYPAFHVVLPN